MISSEYFIGNWEEDGTSFLFFSKPCPQEVKKILDSQPDLILLDNYHMAYEQWLGERFAAFNAGGFFVAPPWEDAVTIGDEPKIILDPGLVFGTGTHPTTRDCLSALEFVRGIESIQSTVDLGTGTGLLALAAAQLGCKNILAVDRNFLAAKTALNNVRLNALEKTIHVICGAAEDWIHYPAELIIANIHYEVIQKLIHSDGFFRKRWFILSGLLRSEAKNIQQLLSRYPIKIEKSWENGGVWHTICGKVIRNKNKRKPFV
jgi:ribosomal protein L11 methyltransferase